MEPDEDVRRIVLSLASLSGGTAMIAKKAARLLLQRSPTEANELISSVIELARQHWLPALVVLPSFMRALDVDGALHPYLPVLKRVAALHGQAEIDLLLVEGQAARVYDSDAAARADAKLVTLPLGVLKTRARLTQNPDELSRLAVVSNALVLREVLQNARLTEDLVVRIAARRPALPGPLLEIWRSPRWSVRPAVRRALVFNPYLPPEVGSKIIPLLARLELENLVREASIHPSIREQARSQVEARSVTVKGSATS
jgi:hypothetical protein